MNLSPRAQVYRTHRQTRKPVTRDRAQPPDPRPSMRTIARLLFGPVADGSRWIEVANEHGVAVTPYPAPKEPR